MISNCITFRCIALLLPFAAISGTLAAEGVAAEKQQPTLVVATSPTQVVVRGTVTNSFRRGTARLEAWSARGRSWRLKSRRPVRGNTLRFVVVTFGTCATAFRSRLGVCRSPQRVVGPGAW